MVIWGTGNVCNHVLKSDPKLIPDFFLDSDASKTNLEIYGKKILHPSQVQNWMDLYIIVAIDNYVTIKQYLQDLGLKEKEQFVWYRDYLFDKTLPEMMEEAETFLSALKKMAPLYRGKSIIFSDFLAFDKGICDYINAWQAKGLDAVLLSEAYWVGNKLAEEKMSIPVCRLPAVLARNQYLQEEIEVSRAIIDFVEGKSFLREASENLRMGYPKMAEGYEYVICYWADKIVHTLIENWEPKEVILWNAFYAFHFIVRKICEEKDIPVKYMEFGNIPGMIQVETQGQMGESIPARFPEKILNIDISEAEYREAEKLIEQLYQNRTNRNKQPKNQLIDIIKRQLMNDKPLILYMGQNDNAAGLQPYTENSRKYHSPIFASSDEAAVYLAEICRKNGWNYIYKPHPMMMQNFQKESMPDNVIVVDEVDINDLIDLSDVVVTILSTVSYIALIRQKPVLMLGYTQLKEKGCTYESFVLEKIESELKRALSQGLSDKMKVRFVEHVAQMKKHYAGERK